MIGRTQTVGALVAATLAAGCAEMKELDDWAMKKAREGRTSTPVASSTSPPTSPPASPPGATPTATYERNGARLALGSASCTFSPGYPKDGHCCIMDRRESAMDVDTAFAGPGEGGAARNGGCS